MTEDSPAGGWQKIADEGVGLYRSGRSAEAVGRLSEALSLMPAPPAEVSHVEKGLLYLNLGSACAESGGLADAAKFLKAALACFTGPEDRKYRVSTLFNLGNVARYSNQWQDTLTYFQQALQLATEINDAERVAMCAINVADFFLGIGARVQDARPYLDRVEAVKDRLGRDSETMRGYLSLRARVALAEGDLEAERQRLAEALALAERGGNEADAASQEANVAVALLEQGRPDLARPHAERAYGITRRLGDRDHLRACLTLADVYEALSLSEEAEPILREAADAMERTRVQLHANEKYLYTEQYAETARRYVGALVRNGNAEDGFAEAERFQSRSLLDLMFDAQIRRQSGRRIFADGGTLFLGTASLGEMREASRVDDTHFLRFAFLSRTRLQGWLLRPDGRIDSWDASEAAPLLDQVVRLLPLSPGIDTHAADGEVGGETLRQGAWPDVSILLGQTYVRLFPPSIQEFLETHDGRLVVVPDGSLHFLPLAALGPPGREPLCFRWSVSLTPSLGAWLHLDARRDPTGRGTGGPYLVAGNAGARTVPVSPVPGGVTRVDVRFQPLPAARSEAKRVAALLQCDFLSGDAFSREGVGRTFETAQVVHLATHGFWDPITGIRSFLLLSDGVLDGQEVQDHDMSAELAVLSGCQTGVGRVHPDSYLGLPQSFLVAGARAVLHSQWPIGDAATVRFMETFYGRLLTPLSPSDALQKTQTDLYAQSQGRNGFVWAGFQLTGRASYPFGSAAPTPLPGPAFCGRQTVADPDGRQENTPLDLGPYTDFRQRRNEQVLLSAGRAIGPPTG